MKIKQRVVAKFCQLSSCAEDSYVASLQENDVNDYFIYLCKENTKKKRSKYEQYSKTHVRQVISTIKAMSAKKVRTQLHQSLNDNLMISSSAMDINNKGKCI